MKLLILTMLLALIAFTNAAPRPPRTRSVGFKDQFGAGYDLVTYKKRDASPEPSQAPARAAVANAPKISPPSWNMPIPESVKGSFSFKNVRKTPSATHHIPVPTPISTPLKVRAEDFTAPTDIPVPQPAEEESTPSSNDKRDAEPDTDAVVPLLFHAPIPKTGSSPSLEKRAAEAEASPEIVDVLSPLIFHVPIPSTGTASTSKNKRETESEASDTIPIPAFNLPKPRVGTTSLLSASSKRDADAEAEPEPELDVISPLIFHAPIPKTGSSPALNGKRDAAAEPES